jgi:hypothetical protein
MKGTQTSGAAQEQPFGAMPQNAALNVKSYEDQNNGQSVSEPRYQIRFYKADRLGDRLKAFF